MIDLPTVNTLVHVVLGGSADFRSKVEDVDGTNLVIGAPMDIYDLDGVIEGSDVDVFWVKSRARYMSPMRIVSRTRGQLGQWHLAATGEPSRCNRRQFVRGEDDGPITITALASDSRAEPVTYEGTLVDICEGGVRCRVPTADLVADEAVLVHFTVGTNPVEIEGAVLSLRPEDIGKGIDVVIEYILEETDAQIIRRHVLQWQMIERRRQLAREERRVAS